MKVGELRKALVDVPDDTEIIVRAWDDDNDYVGTIDGAEVQFAHDENDTPFLAIDCGPEADRETSEEMETALLSSMLHEEEEEGFSDPVVVKVFNGDRVLVQFIANGDHAEWASAGSTVLRDVTRITVDPLPAEMSRREGGQK